MNLVALCAAEVYHDGAPGTLVREPSVCAEDEAPIMRHGLAVRSSPRHRETYVAGARCGSRRRRPSFGEGHRSARLLLVGEQPGDQEDRRRSTVRGSGRPRPVAVSLTDAGITADDVYVTNAVKRYERELQDLQVELGKLHQWVQERAPAGRDPLRGS